MLHLAARVGSHDTPFLRLTAPSAWAQSVPPSVVVKTKHPAASVRPLTGEM